MTRQATQPERRSATHKAAWSVVVLALLVAAVSGGTWAAFTATTDNSGNSFSAGSVTLSDNDSGAAMLTLTSAAPGDSDSGCIRVTYSGSLPATVRLYGTTAGTGLDPYLNLTVTRGTISSGAFDSCANFSADATNYVGAGAGVLYSGTLQGFPDDYANGIVDPTSASPENWTNGEEHAYRFTVTLQDNNAAQGKTATQTFIWEARTS
jgi:predicted ribosomally synthesized peptide with SipW-like signal peptide